MAADVLNKVELMAAIDTAAAGLIAEINKLSNAEVNQVPFEGSWTAGQLFEHIIKATTGIPKALDATSENIGRNPEDKIAELRKMFLDFTTKMKSPKFIEPSEGTHEKQASVNELKSAFADLTISATKADLTQVVKNSPFGDISKLEMLHFVLFHTQRHLPQLENVVASIKPKP